MTDRTKLLIHLNRIHTVFGNALRHGPDGSLEGHFETEHSQFTHYACSFYLAGTLSFLEGRSGAYSWNQIGASGQDFDTFVAVNPASSRASFSSRGICAANMNALAEVRNSVIHNDGDLTQNRNKQSLSMVIAAGLPGVVLNGSTVQLKDPFLDYVRLSAIAVRRFHGED